MHLDDRVYADNPHTGGLLWYGAANLIADSANLLYTRNALGDWSLNRVAAGAETYHILMEVADYRRLLESIDLQQQFGGAQGPAGVAGRPPYAGAAGITPPTAAIPKSLIIRDIVIVYQVGVVALTSVAVAMTRTVFANAVANAITNIGLTPPAYGVAVQATPYVAKIPVTAPVSYTDDQSDLSVEATIVMANTGTLRFYGFGLHCDFNFN